MTKKTTKKTTKPKAKKEIPPSLIVRPYVGLRLVCQESPAMDYTVMEIAQVRRGGGFTATTVAG